MFRGETGRVSGNIMEFLVRHSWETSGVVWGYTALQKVHSGLQRGGKGARDMDVLGETWEERKIRLDPVTKGRMGAA